MISLISFLCFILSDPFSMTGSQYSIRYLDEYVSPPSPLYNFRPKGLVFRFLHLNALSVGHLIPFSLQRSYSLEYPSISPVEWRLFLVLLMVFQGNGYSELCEDHPEGMVQHNGCRLYGCHQPTSNSRLRDASMDLCPYSHIPNTLRIFVLLTYSKQYLLCYDVITECLYSMAFFFEPLICCFEIGLVYLASEEVQSEVVSSYPA